MVTTVTDNSPQSINTSLFSLDKEVQEVKKTTDALNDKLSGINTESGVISVNGKRGIVELDASDVKALPDTTVIPTKTSDLTNDSGFITSDGVGSSFVPVTRKVNNKQLNTDITLTASDVGALPDTTVIPTTTSELTNNSGFITSSDSITGNAATATTADKVKNALTVNGKTYDGSSAVDAGVQTIANGGTGQTTQADINKAFVGALEEGNDVVTDGTMFVSSWASDNGFADASAVNVPYKRKFSCVWEYIKGKISSVLGLTASNYGGKASTAGTADSATKATQDGNGNVITSTYLPRSGGAMTGDIQYKGSKSTDSMIKFIDNTNDAYGNGISIGGGGATIIGGGESSDVLKDTLTSGGDELMMIGNDTNVEIWTNLQDGIASGKKFTFGVDGNITTPLGTVVLKGEVGVPQVVHFNTSNSAGSYELVRFGFRSAFRCVISGTCSNYAEAKIIDVIASSASVPQSNTLGNTAIGPQGNFSFGGGDWVKSSMYWNKPLTEENVYYTVVLIPYSESNVDLVI